MQSPVLQHDPGEDAAEEVTDRPDDSTRLLSAEYAETLEFQRRIQTIIVAAFTVVLFFLIATDVFGRERDLVDSVWQPLFTWVVLATACLNLVVLYLQRVHSVRNARLVAFPIVVLYCVLISILVIGLHGEPGTRYTEFQLFFFLPVLYASLAYDVPGAVGAALVVIFFSALTEIVRRQGIDLSTDLVVTLVVRTGLWLIVALVTGFLTQEEKHLRSRTQGALDQAHQKMRELSALIDIGQQLNSTLNRRQLLSLVVHLATDAVQAEAGSLYLVDEETGELVFEVVTGAKAEEIEGRRLPQGQGIAGWVVANERPVLVPDTSKDNRWYSGIDEESGFTTRSVLCVPLRSREKTVGALQVLNKANGSGFSENDQELCAAMASQVVVALDNARLIDSMETAFLSTVESLATTLEFRDTETEGHSRRVRDMTLAIARQMDVDDQRLPPIGHGALLHDIGKIAVPDKILRKPGKLDDAEWAEMKKHCRQGYEMVSRMEFLVEARDIVYSHQERYDGTGYPRGLAGEEIPLGARVFAVADTFDAMTSDRPYRKAMSFGEAREEIQRCAGSQFDPAVVEAFMEIEDSTLQAIRSRRYTQSQSDELTRTAAEMLTR